ncbi:MAG: ankyrin repeat domain-containing protein [Parachlamydiaceae bacterium]|nr:ankyrin repeat domain-containing protein [Parachlamydiaceae bacterium]
MNILDTSKAAFTYSSWTDSLGDLDVHNITKNIMNIIGYIPVASIVSGIARIIFALNSEEINQDGSLNGHIFRGILEIGSVFGIALISADIAYTSLFKEQINQSQEIQLKLGDLECAKNYQPTRSSIQPREVEPKIITDYRPAFSVLKDKQDRLVPTYLTTAMVNNSKEIQARDKKLNGIFVKTPTPIDIIKTDTRPNKFFTLCEKHFPNFQLHHASDRISDGIAMNAFTVAAYKGNIDLLKALIKAAPELIDLEDANGLTPLIWACCYQDQKIALEMADLLIENGANVNLSVVEHCSFNQIAIFKYSTALYLASLTANDALIELLLKNGAKIEHWLHENKEYFKAISERYNGFPKPEVRPNLYRLNEVQVNSLISISNKVTWEKCMPLVVGHKNYEIVLPKDVVDLIIRIYKAVTPFW